MKSNQQQLTDLEILKQSDDLAKTEYRSVISSVAKEIHERIKFDFPDYPGGDENHFFSAKLKVADDKTCSAPWNGKRDGSWFYCGFCGRSIVIGMSYRILYTNDLPGSGGNPICCVDCVKPTAELRRIWHKKAETWKAIIKDPQWRFFSERGFAMRNMDY